VTPGLSAQITRCRLTCFHIHGTERKPPTPLPMGDGGIFLTINWVSGEPAWRWRMEDHLPWRQLWPHEHRRTTFSLAQFLQWHLGRVLMYAGGNGLSAIRPPRPPEYHVTRTIALEGRTRAGPRVNKTRTVAPTWRSSFEFQAGHGRTMSSWRSSRRGTMAESKCGWNGQLCQDCHARIGP